LRAQSRRISQDFEGLNEILWDSTPAKEEEKSPGKSKPGQKIRMSKL
jgi:hypothetical protein